MHLSIYTEISIYIQIYIRKSLKSCQCLYITDRDNTLISLYMGNGDMVSRWRVIVIRSENLATTLSDENSFFKLRTPNAIASNSSPIIIPMFNMVALASIYHRFDSEYLPHFHLALAAQIGVMEDSWRLMELSANAMTCVSLDDREALLVASRLYLPANIPVWCAWFADGDCVIESSTRSVDQPLTLAIYLPNSESSIEIRVEAILEQTYVKVNNVALLQSALVGYAVADDFIYTGAN